MKTLTVACSIALVLFTAMVLSTDGLPTAPAYVVLTALTFLVPLFTVFVIVRTRGGRRSPLWRVAAICNVVLLVMIGWAIVDQHPHPDEAGFLEYVALMLFTPAISVAFLLRADWVQRRSHAGASA